MDKIKLKALGKINLGLDVLGRRPNGYHDVRMVMQTVYLYDQILLEKTDKEGISLKTNLFYLPVNENNLAYRAAKMLIDEFAIKEGGETYSGCGRYGRRKLQCGSSALWNEPFISAGAYRPGIDGAWREVRGRCTLLYYERNRFGRGNR